MTEIVTTLAAWQTKPGQPFELSPVDLPVPAENEILVKNAAVAINPLDWLLQDHAMLPWLDYPAILGSDIAGEVVAIGRSVTRFRIGDRVLAQAVGTTVNQPAQGAFQTHTIAFEHMAAPIPSAMAFTDAAVLPLGLGTAACGLYQQAHLGLARPSLAPTPTGQVVLVWGGSSSVGCNAIQLAVASGYECIAVASLKHAAMLMQLGASQVLDYEQPTIVADTVKALHGKVLAGALHATGDMADCFAVVRQCEGRRFVATTLPPPEDRCTDVEAKHIFGTSLKDDEVSSIIYRDFLPSALAAKTYHAAPPPRIAGHGLDAFQVAVEMQKGGVSGEKMVVTLP
ncbi:zinc-binding alcohol dehydrogenase family protein [Caballeronia sordidicola]|uniref:Oxidoreductase n=1 Tax=Caballeronia sordidicola TaxID=196367 RepID=A0A242MTC6_CABSO|nr:zinc-binding alcohol dehydrogenase family protein [Caballeronia sordidicola]OTP74507.1 Oxidoreductase [Caballeronia sordidicola]